jgi:cytochrome c-type biogenesis protein CcmH/NrfF
MRRALVTVALALAVAAPAGAQEPKVDLYDVEDEVMCVSCRIPLYIAESPQADRQRALIRSYIDEGLTKDQIKTRLVAEYGEGVLAMPEDDGTGLAAKLVPIAAVLAAVIALALLIPRWRRRPPAAVAATTPAGAGPASDAELKRLDEDLDRFG